MQYSGLASLMFASGVMALSSLPVTAQSSQPGDAFIQQLFGKPKGPSSGYVCFKRRYDSAHLATHPQQNVTRMLLLVSMGGDGDQAASYRASIGVNFRTRKPQFEVEGFCSKGANGLDCGVECDGGKIDVEARDANSVRVKIPDGARVSKPGDENPEGDRGKTFGADDKVFRLDRTKLTDCLPIVHDAKKRAALTRGR